MKNNKSHTNTEIIEIIKATDLLRAELLLTDKQARAVYKKINRLK